MCAAASKLAGPVNIDVRPARRKVVFRRRLYYKERGILLTAVVGV